jgi:hypothetical protein
VEHASTCLPALTLRLSLAACTLDNRDALLQGYRDALLQGYRDVRLQGYRDVRLQGYRDARLEPEREFSADSCRGLLDR